MQQKIAHFHGNFAHFVFLRKLMFGIQSVLSFRTFFQEGGTSPYDTAHGGLIVTWYGSLHSVTPAPQFLDQPLVYCVIACMDYGFRLYENFTGH